MRRLDLAGGSLLVPTELPPVPEITGGLTWRWYEGARAFIQDRPSGPARRFVPHPDLYLRAAELDPNDHDAVGVFIEAHGPFGIDPRTPMCLRPAVGPMSEVLSRDLELVGAPEWFPGLKHQFAEGRRRLADMAAAGDLGHAVGAVHVAELQLSVEHAIDTLTVLVRDWRMVRKAGTDRLPRDETGQRVSYDPVAQRLATLMQYALRPFTPRVMYLEPDDDVWLAKHVATPPLFSVLCLQLARHIAADAPYRICAYDACRLPFTAQAGRSQHGRHRADSMYCDSTCAVRAAQQRYRRRKKIASASGADRD